METAVASVLQLNATAAGLDFSEQQLFYCMGDMHVCDSGWTLEAALLAMRSSQKLLQEHCLPYEADVVSAKSTELRCAPKCKQYGYAPAQGVFDFQPIRTAWRAQQHIREFGSVLTRLDLYQDLLAFGPRAKAGVVYKPAAGLAPPVGHAALLIGYNNVEQYWLVKNSFGPHWGDAGTFKVAYGAASVLDPDMSFGVTWQPAKSSPVVPQRLPVTPLPAAKQPGCYTYKAGSADYMSKVAAMSGVPLAKFMAANSAAVTDLDRSIEGQALRVCNPDRERVVDMSLPHAADIQRGIPPNEMEALVAFKDMVDEKRSVDQGWPNWREAFATGTRYCDLTVFDCEKVGGVDVVVGVKMFPVPVLVPPESLQGALPPARVLRGLPHLRSLYIEGFRGIKGTLPDDWGALTQLLSVYIVNCGLTGTIPASWAGMRQLRRLNLTGNRLEGSLPASFRSLALLNVLSLGFNKLGGKLPASWSQLARLQQLDVSANLLTGPLPVSWGQLRSLMALWLSNNRLSGPLPPAWAQLKDLLVFAAGSNVLTGTLPAQFSQWTAVRAIWLRSNLLRGTLPAAWSGLARLEQLQLGLSPRENGITGSLPASWGALKALRDLQMVGQHLTGTLPASWQGMEAMESLSVCFNDITGTIPTQWAQGMRRLRMFCTNSNPRLQGCVPKAWKGVLRKTEEEMDASVVQVDQDLFGLVTANTRLSGFCKA
uniref:LysM domain-containing protein n=1 Tax=Tetradesmus obliquus TaxID=3088 RepID=A0A383VNV4_TETOB|eukprot:jgi/Sobl393_1/12083/SZX66570.1